MRVFALLCLAAAAAATPLEEFNAYSARFGKTYAPAEFDARFGAFKARARPLPAGALRGCVGGSRAPAQASLARIAESNAKHVAGGGGAIYGLTKFSDLTTAEFASMFLT